MENEFIDIEETQQILLNFDKRNGLLPVVVQESSTGLVLMVASINKEALESTITKKLATFYSTSRKKLWTKGEESGNYLMIDEVFIDCDQDAVIYKVTLKKGGVCHTFNKEGINRKSCFYRKINLDTNNLEFLEK
ncbi:MAG: phosphoribosyl-AMP cyclohydrolase [Solirubrobacteraceae bacterium]